MATTTNVSMLIVKNIDQVFLSITIFFWQLFFCVKIIAIFLLPKLIVFLQKNMFEMLLRSTATYLFLWKLLPGLLKKSHLMRRHTNVYGKCSKVSNTSCLPKIP